eukprot:CFRG6258T1
MSSASRTLIHNLARSVNDGVFQDSVYEGLANARNLNISPDKLLADIRATCGLGYTRPPGNSPGVGAMGGVGVDHGWEVGLQEKQMMVLVKYLHRLLEVFEAEEFRSWFQYLILHLETKHIALKTGLGEVIRTLAMNDTYILYCLMQYYFRWTSEHAKYILASVADSQCEAFFPELSSFLSKPRTRLFALQLLAVVAKNQGPNIHRVAKLGVLDALVQCLKRDRDVIVVTHAVVVLTILIPNICSFLSTRLNDVLGIFVRLVGWSSLVTGVGNESSQVAIDPSSMPASSVSTQNNVAYMMEDERVSDASVVACVGMGSNTVEREPKDNTGGTESAVFDGISSHDMYGDEHSSQSQLQFSSMAPNSEAESLRSRNEVDIDRTNKYDDNRSTDDSVNVSDGVSVAGGGAPVEDDEMSERIDAGTVDMKKFGSTSRHLTDSKNVNLIGDMSEAAVGTAKPSGRSVNRKGIPFGGVRSEVVEMAADADMGVWEGLGEVVQSRSVDGMSGGFSGGMSNNGVGVNVGKGLVVGGRTLSTAGGGTPLSHNPMHARNGKKSSVTQEIILNGASGAGVAGGSSQSFVVSSMTSVNTENTSSSIESTGQSNRTTGHGWVTIVETYPMLQDSKGYTILCHKLSGVLFVYFQHLYGIWPGNTLRYLHIEITKGKKETQHLLRPFLRSVVLNEMLVELSLEEELDSNRWKSLDAQTIAALCLRYSTTNESSFLPEPAQDTATGLTNEVRGIANGREPHGDETVNMYTRSTNKEYTMETPRSNSTPLSIPSHNSARGDCKEMNKVNNCAHTYTYVHTNANNALDSVHNEHGHITRQSSAPLSSPRLPYLGVHTPSPRAAQDGALRALMIGQDMMSARDIFFSSGRYNAQHGLSTTPATPPVNSILPSEEYQNLDSLCPVLAEPVTVEDHAEYASLSINSNLPTPSQPIPLYSSQHETVSIQLGERSDTDSVCVGVERVQFSNDKKIVCANTQTSRIIENEDEGVPEGESDKVDCFKNTQKLCASSILTQGQVDKNGHNLNQIDTSICVGRNTSLTPTPLHTVEESESTPAYAQVKCKPAPANWTVNKNIDDKIFKHIEEKSKDGVDDCVAANEDEAVNVDLNVTLKDRVHVYAPVLSTNKGNIHNTVASRYPSSQLVTKLEKPPNKLETTSPVSEPHLHIANGGFSSTSEVRIRKSLPDTSIHKHSHTRTQRQTQTTNPDQQNSIKGKSTITSNTLQYNQQTEPGHHQHPYPLDLYAYASYSDQKPFKTHMHAQQYANIKERFLPSHYLSSLSSNVVAGKPPPSQPDCTSNAVGNVSGGGQHSLGYYGYDEGAHNILTPDLSHYGLVWRHGRASQALMRQELQLLLEQQHEHLQQAQRSDTVNTHAGPSIHTQDSSSINNVNMADIVGGHALEPIGETHADCNENEDEIPTQTAYNVVVPPPPSTLASPPTTKRTTTPTHIKGNSHSSASKSTKARTRAMSSGHPHTHALLGVMFQGSGAISPQSPHTQIKLAHSQSLTNSRMQTHITPSSSAPDSPRASVDLSSNTVSRSQANASDIGAHMFRGMSLEPIQLSNNAGGGVVDTGDEERIGTNNNSNTNGSSNGYSHEQRQAHMPSQEYELWLEYESKMEQLIIALTSLESHNDMLNAELSLEIYMKQKHSMQVGRLRRDIMRAKVNDYDMEAQLQSVRKEVSVLQNAYDKLSHEFSERKDQFVAYEKQMKIQMNSFRNENLSLTANANVALEMQQIQAQRAAESKEELERSYADNIVLLSRGKVLATRDVAYRELAAQIQVLKEEIDSKNERLRDMEKLTKELKFRDLDDRSHDLMLQTCMAEMEKYKQSYKQSVMNLKDRSAHVENLRAMLDQQVKMNKQQAKQLTDIRNTSEIKCKILEEKYEAIKAANYALESRLLKLYIHHEDPDRPKLLQTGPEGFSGSPAASHTPPARTSKSPTTPTINPRTTNARING